MSLPSTITTLIEPYHGIGGPFVSSTGAVYVVTRTSNGIGVQIFKAADPAASWSGVSSLAVTSGNTVRAVHAYQVSDVIHIVSRDAGTAASNQIRYHTFDMATDAFVTSNQLVKTTYTQKGTVDESRVGIVVRSGGAVLVLYEGPQVLADIQRARTYYARHLGSAWSADIALDNGGNVDWYPQEIILGSGNRAHFFFLDATNNALYQRTLTSANALETFPSAFDTSLTNNDDVGFQNGIAYSGSAGGTVIRFPYYDSAAHTLSDVIFTSADAPSPLTVSTSITGATIAPLPSIRNVVSLAKDDSTVYGTFVNNVRSITFDNAAYTTTTSVANSFGLLLTATGDTVLLVFTMAGGSDSTISTMAVGATSLPFLGAVEWPEATGRRSELWGLTAPASGVLTISAVLADGAAGQFGMAGVTYVGQRTTATPFGGVVVGSASVSATTSIILSSTSTNLAVFGFTLDFTPGTAAVVSPLTQRVATPASWPSIVVGDTTGAANITGSATASTATNWGGIGINLIASATSTRGVYLMSSNDAVAWSEPALVQAATGINVWTNCFVRDSKRVVAIVYNDAGSIKYTEYSLSAAASVTQFIARLGLMGVGR
jgi:hypothetical protein